MHTSSTRKVKLFQGIACAAFICVKVKSKPLGIMDIQCMLICTHNHTTMKSSIAKLPCYQPIISNYIACMDEFC